mmetsp:Transcript_26675/g.41410  ORF Transcript_26675/g.41410 Transcript_26675/m.41410 type:complete len:102 (+) Transcript_26675:214-519(+)
MATEWFAGGFRFSELMVLLRCSPCHANCKKSLDAIFALDVVVALMYLQNLLFSLSLCWMMMLMYFVCQTNILNTQNSTGRTLLVNTYERMNNMKIFILDTA